ncbi:MAG: tetratricopeptide repeat protein [Deltaproteobacteria bacterium]|nr:tetratricopeptide repeat protein [Deltaproteobacteria bacterium]
MLIAEHPTFAALYARGEIGEPEAVPVPTPKAVPGRPRLDLRELSTSAARVAAAVLVAGGVVAFGAWVYLHREDIQERVAATAVPPLEVPAGGEAAVEAKIDAPVTPAPEAGRVHELLTRVGHVDEPRAVLLARAWAERTKGGRTGLEAAILHAERAVARSPRDPESLGLLSVLLAEARTDLNLARALATRCDAVLPSADACQRAQAALLLAKGEAQAARAAVSDCAGRGDLECRALYANAAAAESAHPAEAMGGVRKLLEAWPQNRELARVLALLSTDADLPDARTRVEATRREIRDDPALEAAYAGLCMLDGQAMEGIAMAVALGDDAPPALRVRAAAVAIDLGDVARGLVLVGDIGTRADLPEGVRRSARLVAAQGRYLEARRDAAKLEAARAATASLVELGRTDPAVAQVRALVGRLAGDDSEEVRAWASMDTSARMGAELARVLDTQVALGLETRQPVSDLLPLAEQARRADLSAPEPHLWLARVHLEGHNPALAIDVLLDAIVQVDGQAGRRRPGLAALWAGAPAKEVNALLEGGVGNDVTFGRAFHLALATAAWLGGDIPGARLALDAVGSIDDDPAAIALRGRLKLAARDNDGAADDFRLVVQQRPKQGEFQLALVQSLVATGNYDEARKYIDTVSSSPLSSAMVPNVRAEVRAHTGETEAAKRDFAEAIKRDPFDAQARVRLRELATEG